MNHAHATDGWHVTVKASYAISPLRFAGAFALGYVGSLFCAAIGASTAAAFDAGETVTLACGSLGLWVGFVTTTIVLADRGVSHSAPRRLNSLPLLRIALAIAVGALTQLVVLPVIYAPITRLWSLDLDAPARELIDDARGWRIALFTVIVVAGAPVFEELFFRGLLLGELARRLGPRRGLIASATIFSATHFQPAQFAGLFVAGLVFGGIALKTGRLSSAVWAHAAFNAVTVIVLRNG